MKRKTPPDPRHRYWMPEELFPQRWRYQSARHRELVRTLEAFRKLRNADFVMGNGEKADGKCQMADDECQMADDECQVAEGELQVAEGELKMGDEQCEVEAGGCDERQSSEPMTEGSGSSGPVAGHDSQHVTEDATHDIMGSLSREGAHAAGQPGQGDGVGQCLPDDVTTPPKAPNKANLESKHSLESQELKSETAGAEGWKQSQSPQGETTRKPRSRDGRPARQSGRRPVASEAEGSQLLRAAGVPPLRRSDDLDSPGDEQMKSRTYRVTLADLTKSTSFRTKDGLQSAAQFTAMNPERLGEVDPELLAKIDEMADEPDS